MSEAICRSALNLKEMLIAAISDVLDGQTSAIEARLVHFNVPQSTNRTHVNNSLSGIVPVGVYI
jgi:hypothetical protein